ncbi:Lectin subunit alpha [Pseudolycoriella hygida]|uniref:Lectin subunit alpha n=1 Tax=Pseudolycoriella hygida TaxID=35572 RepID=A0A9Q0S1W7_9DIPT|nr:Lectin subunit alpha [Pseudolycoriella hygida]
MKSSIYFLVLLTTLFCAKSAKTAGSGVRKTYLLQYFAKVNWYDAFLNCQRNGLRLATINSADEEKTLIKIVEKAGMKNNHFWISAADLAKEGRFSWYSTGDLVTYKNFRKSQPDNYRGNEHCVQFSNIYAWNDVRCNALAYFICEKAMK